MAAMEEMTITLGSSALRNRGTSPAVRKYTPLMLTVDQTHVHRKGAKVQELGELSAFER